MLTMSTTDSVQVFAADDGKDLWAPSTVWWNGSQQLPPSAVNNFAYDYPLPVPASYDAAGCQDNNGPFYNMPMIDVAGNPWPVSAQTTTNEELYVSAAAPVCSVIDQAYKYPSAATQSALDYAVSGCYNAAVAGPATPCNQTPWTTTPYPDTITSGVAGYEPYCSVAMPAAVSIDYCNSLQMTQYGAAFNGFAMLTNQFPSDTDNLQQQCETTFNKTASTYRPTLTDSTVNSVPGVGKTFNYRMSVSLFVCTD